MDVLHREDDVTAEVVLDTRLNRPSLEFIEAQLQLADNTKLPFFFFVSSISF